MSPTGQEAGAGSSFSDAGPRKNWASRLALFRVQCDVYVPCLTARFLFWPSIKVLARKEIQMRTDGCEQRWVKLAEVARERGVAYGTVYRWVKSGVLGIRLQVASRGYNVVTTPDWLVAFDDGISRVRESRGKNLVAATSRRPRRNGAAARVRAKHGI